MVLPLGSIINSAAVVIGGGLGLVAGRAIGEKLRDSLFQVIGLCTVLIGLKMALVTDDLMPVILSCVLGIVTGEAVRLEKKLARAGDGLKKAFRSKNEKFTDGFITTSMVICIGAMAIIGSLEEGLGGGPATLLSKSILDFFVAMMMASIYGSGAVAAALPLLVYQGGLTLLAALIEPYLTDGIRLALVSTGGLMMVGLGFNLLGYKSISIQNLLPALVYAVILGALMG